MPLAVNIEAQINRIEGFEIEIVDLDGRKLNSNHPRQFSSYKQKFGSKMAKNRWTVAEWKTKRFQKLYQEVDCRVFYKGHKECGGGTLFGTVRDSYL